MALWIYVLLMVVRASLSASISPSSNEIIDCQSDDDCPKNQYCYDTGVCAACYECGVYFRFPSLSGCAKTPQMCGGCENGYENEILSGGKVRDTCTRIPTFQPETNLTGAMWNSAQTWLFGVFVIMGLVVLVVLLAVWGGEMVKSWAAKMLWRTGATYNLPSAPPLPSKDCEISRLCVEEPLVTHFVKEDIVATKSKPFDTSQISPKVVGWHSGDNGLGSHTQSYGEASGYQPNGQNPPDLEDDSTTPSTWTPETLSEGALVTSFAGLFSPNNNSNNFNNNLPHSSIVQNFTPNSSFNDSERSNSNSSSGSGGGSSGGSPGGSPGSTNGPVHILVQGGLGQSSVQCSVMVNVNNVQINEY